MSAVLIQAEERRDLRRSYGKQLRNSGKIPAVVYGKEAGSTPIAVEEKDLMTVLKTDPNAVIQMNIPDIGNMPVMIHEIQRDMLKGHLLHVDFLQINMEREVSATVRVNLKGDPVGVKQEGGVLQTEVYDVDIQCLPGKIPMEITADISQLHIGDSLLVKDLQLPEGVELLSDPDQYIASVVPPQKPEETDGGGEQTEGKAETTE